MPHLKLFDAHCYVGRYKTFQPGSFHTVERLLEEMDHFGIAEALVMHTTAREHHPAVGNPLTCEICQTSPRLHPVWSFVLSAAKEIPRPEQFVSDMAANGVKSVKLFYGFYNIPLADWVVGDYLSAFEDKRIPVFLDPDVELSSWADDTFDWNAVHAICEDHPNLPVILQGARFRSSNRLLYKLLEKHENLHVELSGYWGYHGIEFICREFGTHRFLFGTRLPVRDAGCAVAMVTYADLPDHEKRLVAGENLKRMLGEVRI